MDPLTHTISGVFLGNMFAPDSHRVIHTAIFVVAANLPDIDFVTRPIKTLGTPKYYHKFTHSILGVLILSILATWGTRSLFPLGSGLLFCTYLLGCSVHLLLDTLLSSCNVRLLWPFTNRHFSMNLLVGLNSRTSSKKCGRPHYVRCTLCQLKGAFFNPILLLLLLGTVAAVLYPSHRALFSALILLCIIFYCVVMYLWRRLVRQRIVEKYHDVDPSSLYLYPSDIIPFRWLAIEEKEKHYQLFSIRGIAPRVERNGTLPRPETVSNEAVALSTESPLYTIYRSRMAHPYVETRQRDGTTQIIWKDLRYLQNPVVSLYTLKIEYDATMRLLKEEFRERWND